MSDAQKRFSQEKVTLYRMEDEATDEALSDPDGGRRNDEEPHTAGSVKRLLTNSWEQTN